MSIAQWDNVAKIFKGYVTYGSNTIQHLVSVDLRIDGGFQIHYATDGSKKPVSVGDRSTYVLRIDDATDMYSGTAGKGATFSGADLISKVIQGITDNKPQEITFNGIQKDDASSSKMTTYEIKGFGVSVDHNRNASSGTYEVEITLEVTSVKVTKA